MCAVVVLRKSFLQKQELFMVHFVKTHRHFMFLGNGARKAKWATKGTSARQSKNRNAIAHQIICNCCSGLPLQHVSNPPPQAQHRPWNSISIVHGHEGTWWWQTGEADQQCKFYAFGISVSYYRVMEVKHSMARAVMKQFCVDGVVLPTNIRSGVLWHLM